MTPQPLELPISKRLYAGGPRVSATHDNSEERQDAYLLETGAVGAAQRKLVQETVAQLGDLDAAGRASAEQLARPMYGDADQYELCETREPSRARVQVQLDRLRWERSRRSGDIWLGGTLWRALGLDRFCREHMAAGREKVDSGIMAAILVTARLGEPSSELHLAEDWYRRTVLEDMMDVPAEHLNDDRLYRALDRLLPHKCALDVHLKARLGELLSLE